MNSPAKRILILFITFLYPFISSFGQKRTIGAFHFGLADIATLHSNESFFQNNPSFLAFERSTKANLSSSHPYISSEIATNSIGVSSQFKDKSGIGFSLTRDGINHFNTTNLSLAYGTLITKKVAIGIQTHFQYLSIDKRHSKLLILPEIGIAGKLDDNWAYSFILFNPTRQYYNKELQYSSPSQITLGGNYNKDNYTLALEINKQSQEPLLVSWGGIYSTSEKIKISLGFKSNSSISGGFSYRHQQLLFALASSYHLTLGFSPSISLIYEFSTKN